MYKKNVFWVLGITLIIIFCSNSLSQVPYQITYETEGISDFVWSPDGSQFAYIALENDTTRLFLEAPWCGYSGLSRIPSA